MVRGPVARDAEREDWRWREHILEFCRAATQRSHGLARSIVERHGLTLTGRAVDRVVHFLKKASMTPSVGPFVVATEDGTMFHCSLNVVGRDQELRWVFRDARGLEHIGPPARNEKSRDAVRALVAEWWENRNVRPIRVAD